MIIKGMNT